MRALGLSIVKLVKINGCNLTVNGLDAIKGSPIIDIKPYIPRADSVPDAQAPKWTLKALNLVAHATKKTVNGSFLLEDVQIVLC